MLRSQPLRRSPLSSSSTWKRRKVTFTGPMPDTKAIVSERDQHCCVLCGKGGRRGVDLSVHHRRPRRLGGDRRPETNLPANLVILCGSGTFGCHGWVESNRIEALALGLLLHADEDPAATPMAAWYGVVWLDNDGHLWPVN